MDGFEDHRGALKAEYAAMNLVEPRELCLNVRGVVGVDPEAEMYFNDPK